MRTASRKGLGPPTRGLDLQDGRYNVDVGDDKAYNMNTEYHASYDKNNQLIDVSVRT
jgi:hypothetical protein